MPALTDQDTAVPAQMLKELVALHAEMLTSS
jgi:hypothetical protein